MLSIMPLRGNSRWFVTTLDRQLWALSHVWPLQDNIAIICQLLRGHASNQSEIVEHCKLHGVSKRVATAVLSRYRGELWMRERQSKNNALLYELKTIPPGKPANRKTGTEIAGI